MLKYFLGLLAFILVTTKSYVFYQERYLYQLKKELESLNSDLHLLKTEWHFRNSPSKLMKSCMDLLPNHKNIDSKDIKNLDDQSKSNEFVAKKPKTNSQKK